MLWKAWLTGHDFDLHELAVLFRAAAHRSCGKAITTTSPPQRLTNAPPAEPFYEAAARVLTLVNGVAKANNSGFRPVALSGKYHEGERQHAAPVAGTAFARTHAFGAATVIGSDGTVRPDPPPPGPSRVAAATRHRDAAEALEIMAKAEPTNWVDLYKVYEIIEHTGDLRAVMRELGVSNNRISLFTQTAGHPAAAGSDARHSRLNKQAPKDPMLIGEARDLIGQILTAWLDSLR